MANQIFAGLKHTKTGLIPMDETLYRRAYNIGKEIVPDYVYDRMGLLDVDDSIGVGEWAEHKHIMLSLHTEFCNLEQITAKEIHERGVPYLSEYIISAKVDGVAISLQSNGGKYRLLTRGRRTQGWLIHPCFLNQMKPLKHQLPDYVELRGDFMLREKDFEELSLLFDTKFSNARSMVSAMLNSNTPDGRVVEKMFILWHGIQGISRKKSHVEEIQQYVDKADIVPYEIVNSNRIGLACRRIYKESQELDYACDGIVFECSKKDDKNEMNHLDRIAFKQFDEAKYCAESKVTNISWKQGSDGHYFPRIEIEPVVINGIEVSHTAGYCYDYLQRLGISIGSVVIITLHGGAIPYVSTVKSSGSKELNLPKNIAPIKKGDIDIWSLDSVNK